MNWQRKAFNDAIQWVEEQADRKWVGAKEAQEALFLLRVMRPQNEEDRAFPGFFDGRDWVLSRYPNGRPGVKVCYRRDLDLLGVSVYKPNGASAYTCYSMSPLESIEAFAARVYMTCINGEIPIDTFTVTNRNMPSQPVGRRAEMDVRFLPDEGSRVIVYEPHERAIRWWFDHGVKIEYDD